MHLELLNNLKRQSEVLESMIQAFKGLERAVVAKDTQLVSKYGANIEELSFEISRLEDEKEVILKKLGFDTVKDYIEHSDKPLTYEVALKLAEIVEKINELSIVMQSIRNMFEFQMQYVNLLNTLLKGIESPTYAPPVKNSNNRYYIPSERTLYDRNF
uniref:Flagellar biosynthesis protein FlgN n=1 Tax=Fervidobacterium thailandense TaxID=1008305 RepID=A0A7C4RX32_9BACT